MKSIIKIIWTIGTCIIYFCALCGVLAFVQDRIVEISDKVKPAHRQGLYERFVKRPLDMVLSCGALIVFSPILLITSILVKLKLGSPVIFAQDRPGKDEKIFKLYKFRTMTNQKDENGNLLPDEQRLTPFGVKLRETSLDELPELINIVKGDMAVVGPRPLLVRYLERYDSQQRRRHEVRPGLTGYAQAHGRNSNSWEDKFNKDIYYVDHVSFKTDLKIIIDTVKVVINREGISSDTSATMEEFYGTETHN